LDPLDEAADIVTPPDDGLGVLGRLFVQIRLEEFRRGRG